MPIRRHQRNPGKYDVSAWDGGPNSTWLSSSGILTKDPIANRTPMASQAVAGLFQYWSPAAQTRISGLSGVMQGLSGGLVSESAPRAVLLHRQKRTARGSPRREAFRRFRNRNDPAT